MKKIILLNILLIAQLFSFGQTCIPNPPYSSSGCGSFNAITQVTSLTPICYYGCITIQLNTDVIADSICLKTGDGNNTTIIPTGLITIINYCYNLKPDSCPNQNPLTLLIEAEYYSCCPSGFSYQYTSTSVSIMFLPKIQITSQTDSICKNQNFILTPSGCHNGFSNHPATMTVDFGDGTIPVIFSNLTIGGFPAIPPHQYNIAGIFWPSIEISNDCGSKKDSIKIIVAEITGVTINPMIVCTGMPLNATVNSINGGGFNVTVSPSTGVLVTGQNTSNPQFTFQFPGSYSIHFSISIPEICPVDCVIIVTSGPNMNLIHKPDECFDGTNLYNFSTYFSSTNPAQTNFFSLTPLGGIPIYQTITSGIPTTAIPIPSAGTYVALDSSNTQCPGSILRSDTFNIINPIILPNYPKDTTCIGSTLTLPVAPPGVSILLNGNPVTTSTFLFNLSGITFNFVYTPANGCGNPSTYSVYVHNGPNMNLIHKPDECFDGTNLYNFSTYFSSTNPAQTNFFSLTPLGGIPIYQTITSGIPTTAIPIPSAGTYVALDSSNTQCPGSILRSDTFNIINPIILPNYPKDTTCIGSTLTLPVAPPGVSILLNGNPVTTSTFLFNLSGITFNFVYTPANGCGNPSTYSVYVHNGPNMNLIHKPDECFDGTNLYNFSTYFSSTNPAQTNFFSLTPLGGIPIYQTITSGIPTTAIPIPSAGTYVALDSSNTQCPGSILRSDTFNIINPIILPNYPKDTTCIGSTLTLPVAPPGVSILLNGNPVTTSTFLFNLSGITFNFVYTPANGCGNPSTYSVYVHNGPNMNLIHKPDECFDGTNLYNFSTYFSSTNPAQTNFFSLTPLGGIPIYQTITSGIPTTAIPIPSAGTYVALDSSNTQCPGSILRSDTFNIINPIILPNYPKDTTCIGSTLTLPVAPPGVSILLNGNPVTTSTFLFNLSGITFNFVYTPANGCGNPSTYSVYVRNGVNLNVSNYNICQSIGSDTLYATPSGGVFSGPFISSNIFNVAASGLGTFLYYYTYTDTTGCIYIDSATITVNNQTNPIYTASQYICLGNSFQLSITSGSSTVILDTLTYFNTNNLSLIIMIPGWHYFTIQDMGNCGTVAKDSFYVQTPPSPIQLAVTPMIGCSSTLVTISSTTVTIPNIIITYTFPDGTTTTQNPPPSYLCIMPPGLDSSQFVFTVTVTVPSCSPQISSQTVTLFNNSIAGFTSTHDTVCPNEIVSFLNTTSRIWMIDTVQWFVDGILSSIAWNLPSQTFYADSIDSSHIIMLVVHNYICNTYDTVTKRILAHPVSFPLQINLPLTHYCQGTDFIASTNSLPSGSIIWWTDGNGNIYYGMQSLLLHYDSTGIFTITVHVQSCSLQTYSLQVRIDPKITFNIFSDNQPHCSSGLVSFGINTQFQDSIAGVEWVFGNSLTNNISLSPQVNYSLPGNYLVTLTIISNNGCPNTSSLPLTINETPFAHIVVDSEFCQFTKLSLRDINQSNLNDVDSIIWFEHFNNSVIIYNNENIILLNDTGNYQFNLYITNNGCPGIDSASFHVNATPIPEIWSDKIKTSIYNSKIIFNDVNNNPAFVKYNWDFGDSHSSFLKNPQHEYRESGLYIVKLLVTSQEGCHGEDSITIDVDGSPGLWMPNSFTPNNDGKNELIQPVMHDIREEGYYYAIYNRWGELSFLTNDIHKGWDGHFKGTIAQSGVYCYKILYSCLNNNNEIESHEIKGIINLIR